MSIFEITLMRMPYPNIPISELVRGLPYLLPAITAILPDESTHPATIRARSGNQATPRRPLIADFEFPNTWTRVAFSGRRQLIWLRR